MRAPPPVEYTSTLGRGWRAALSLLVGAAVGAPLAWALPHAAEAGSGGALEGLAEPAIQLAVVLSASAFTVLAFLQWQHRSGADERTLRWDGQDWRLRGTGGRPDQRGDAALMLDLGPWMLVRFRPGEGGGSRLGAWLPLAIGGDAARWAALRGALWNWRASPREARP